ncbi:MAG: ATP-binding cassette domain-containing protein, partial [Pseudomonadota bacterium]
MSETIVLRANDLKKHYMLPGSLYARPATVKALDGVSFELSRKKTLAVVGESGCGKSTLARLVTMIEDPTAGSLQIAGEELADGDKAVRRKLRPKVQMVFQNPYGSLNPRQKIGSALEEPLMMNTPLSKAERSDKAKDMMQAVGLRPEHYDRYPHMFSGGQRQ